MAKKAAAKKTAKKNLQKNSRGLKTATLPPRPEQNPQPSDCPPAPPLAEEAPEIDPNYRAAVAGAAAAAAVDAVLGRTEDAHEDFNGSPDADDLPRRVSPQRAFELVDDGIAPLEVFEGVDPESVLAELLLGGSAGDVNVDQLTASLARVKSKYRGRTIPGGKIGNVDPNITTEEIRLRYGGGRFTIRFLDYANNRVLRSKTMDILAAPKDPRDWLNDDEEPTDDANSAVLREILNRLERLKKEPAQTNQFAQIEFAERMMKLMRPAQSNSGELGAFQLFQLYREAFNEGRDSKGDGDGESGVWDKALDVIDRFLGADGDGMDDGKDEYRTIEEFLNAAKDNNVEHGAALVRSLLVKYGVAAAQISVDHLSQLVALRYPRLQTVVQLPETRAFVERVVEVLKQGG